MTWTLVESDGRYEVQRVDGGLVVTECASEDKALEYVSSLYHYWSLDMPGERELAAAPPGANAPYKIQMRGGQWVVVNNAGVVKSTFNDRDKALAYLRALYANVKGAAARAAKVRFSGKAKDRAEKAAMPGTPLHTFTDPDNDGLCDTCLLPDDVCKARFGPGNAVSEQAKGAS